MISRNWDDKRYLLDVFSKKTKSRNIKVLCISVKRQTKIILFVSFLAFINCKIGIIKDISNVKIIMTKFLSPTMENAGTFVCMPKLAK